MGFAEYIRDKIAGSPVGKKITQHREYVDNLMSALEKGNVTPARDADMAVRNNRNAERCSNLTRKNGLGGRTLTTIPKSTVTKIAEKPRRADDFPLTGEILSLPIAEQRKRFAAWKSGGN